MANSIITEKSIIQLNPNIAIRYEHNFNNGTVILIDTNSKIFWFGNKESYNLIRKLKNNTKTVKELYSEILETYPANRYPEVVDALNALLSDLENNKLLILCKII